MTEGLEQRAARYRPLVADEMRAVIGDSAAGLFAWMRYHLGWEDARGRAAQTHGGKMLRPVALLLATELVGGSAEEAVPAAAAVELVHNFSLIHDDIEDESPRRRGRATLWTLTGTAQAINAGDGMYTLARLAMHRLPGRGVEERRVIEATRELDEACLRLVEGQYLDLLFETRDRVGRDEYVTMAGGKAAAMFAAPFAMGALLGGADGGAVSALREFGRHVGLAFQAVDDVLGIWGDPAVTGKPAGDDLHARKMTYPVIAAMEAGGDESDRFARSYARQAQGEEDVSGLAELIERLEGRAATEAFAAEEERAALVAIEPLGLDAKGVAALSEYVRAAIGRVA